MLLSYIDKTTLGHILTEIETECSSSADFSVEKMVLVLAHLLVQVQDDFGFGFEYAGLLLHANPPERSLRGVFFVFGAFFGSIVLVSTIVVVVVGAID